MYSNTRYISSVLLILPIKLNVDTPESYTFAIFGENGVNEIEEEPAFIVKFKIPTTAVQPLPSQSPSPGIYFDDLLMPVLVVMPLCLNYQNLLTQEI